MEDYAGRLRKARELMEQQAEIALQGLTQVAAAWLPGPVAHHGKARARGAERTGSPSGFGLPTQARGAMQNFAINPMDHSQATRLHNLRQAPRCGARTRGGTPCQRPALRGRKRCRLHGGLSPGAPRGQKNGNFKTGNWTIEAIEERNWLRSLLRSFAKPTRTE